MDSTWRDDSLDALEALLRIKMGPGPSIMPHFPVPNPLDPTQPHIIEGEVSIVVAQSPVAAPVPSPLALVAQSPLLLPAPASPTVPNPLTDMLWSQDQDASTSLMSLNAKTTAKASGVKGFLRRARAAIPSSEPTAPAHGFLLDPQPSAPVEEVPTLDIATTTHEATMCYPQTAQLFPPPSPAAFDDANSSPSIQQEKILDALQSKPQRGKKRRNLNNLERMELTRTRNREHAKSTRMKKKARHQELLDIEVRYNEMMEVEDLNLRRKERLVDFVEKKFTNDAPLYRRIVQLEGVEVDLSVVGSSATAAVGLSDTNTGFVVVEAQGARSIKMQGVLSVEFQPSSSEIVAAFLDLPSSPMAKANTRTSSRIVIPNVDSESYIANSVSPQKMNGTSAVANSVSFCSDYAPSF